VSTTLNGSSARGRPRGWDNGRTPLGAETFVSTRAVNIAAYTAGITVRTLVFFIGTAGEAADPDPAVAPLEPP